MSGKIKYTTEEYIKLVNKVHEDKYEYSDTIYTGYSSKINVHCKHHGDFLITANYHLKGGGCGKCGVDKRTKTRDEIIEEAVKIHENKYDYSKVVYTSMEDKVEIICPYHGQFWQALSTHVSKKHGCKKCGTIKGVERVTKRISENSLNIFAEVHGDRYDYSKFIYINTSTKGIIVCPKHGEFMQNYSNHIMGSGCPKCGHESHWRRSDYIKKANGRVCTFYTIRCFNDEEEFYKIGITMNTTKSRYYGKVNLPYEYEVISEVKGSAGFIWDLERDEKRKLKYLNYQPTLSFGGSETECFSNYKVD